MYPWWPLCPERRGESQLGLVLSRCRNRYSVPTRLLWTWEPLWGPGPSHLPAHGLWVMVKHTSADPRASSHGQVPAAAIVGPTAEVPPPLPTYASPPPPHPLSQTLNIYEFLKKKRKKPHKAQIMQVVYQAERLLADKQCLEPPWYASYCDLIGDHIKTRWGYYT